MLSFLAAVAALHSTLSIQRPKLDLLNEALQIDGPAAAALFERGYHDGERHRDDDRQVNRLKRGIAGTKRMRGTESAIWALPASLAIYDEGFQARRAFVDSQRVSTEVTNLSQGTFLDHPIIQFRGRLSIAPPVGTRHNRRQPTTNDLGNVRVVLKVGDRIYEPFAEPGGAGLPSRQGFAAYSEIGSPQGFGSWNSPESGWDSRYASATTRHNITHADDFSWYALEFRVGFSLFNQDGSPRFTPEDKDFEILLVCGPLEGRSHFKVSDLAFR